MFQPARFWVPCMKKIKKYKEVTAVKEERTIDKREKGKGKSKADLGRVEPPKFAFKPSWLKEERHTHRATDPFASMFSGFLMPCIA